MKQGLRIYRASVSTYIVFGVIFGGILALYVPIVIRNPSTQMVSAAALLMGSWLITNVWIASFRLEIGPETLAYRRLFGGRTTIKWADVSAARDLYIKSGDPRQGSVRLIEIRTKLGFRRCEWWSIQKVFPREADRQLRDSLQGVWISPKESFVQLFR